MNPSFKPRDYQIEDLARMINSPRTGLGHDPGGGKTYIASMFTDYLHRVTGESIVWTMPGGIMAKNRNDILFSTNFAPEEVAIVQGTPDQRKAMYANDGIKVYLMSATGYANEWGALPFRVRHSIHDEIQLAYTTFNTKRTQDWITACKNKGAVVPMTGTIIKGRLDSAYPTCHVIAPWAYSNDRQFLGFHAWYDENGKVIGWKNHDRLREVLSRSMIFRSFASIYGKENKVIQVQRCIVGPKAWKLYKSLEEDALIELEDSFIDAGNPAVGAMSARQVLASPEKYEIDEKTGKDEALEIYISDHLKTGERLAIFSSFTAEQLRVVRMIEKMGGKVRHINGTVSYQDRQEIDRLLNANEIQFVVASAQTAGIGLNWHFLNTMVFCTIDYTDDSFIQAFRRGIRGTREIPLRIIILKYEDTIEDRIMHIVDRKSRDHNLVNAGIEPLNLGQL